jgi:hypothetical protein
MMGGSHRAPGQRGSGPLWALYLLIAVVIVIALVYVTGCSKPPVSGTIEHKQYSSSVTYYTYPCMAYDSKMRCIMYGLQRNYIPPSWQICVHGPDEDGKIVTGCFDVDPGQFNRVREGDSWPEKREPQ